MRGAMRVVLGSDVNDLGRRAAGYGADLVRLAIACRGSANIVVATGASQFTMLSALTEAPGVDWSVVTGFHLDEYLGLPISHPASFRRYLKERFLSHVPLRTFHYVDGESSDPQAECRRLGEILARHPIDVAFVGIGENGHLAFNDPPADFETESPFLCVALDEKCRRQQFGEGWFPSLDDVPQQAISMSVRQILKAQAIVCSVPDSRKAEAVRAAVEGRVTPNCPASILQQHANCRVFLDPASASMLHNAPRAEAISN
jgi:glucosamine-6-phosphate deaminase